MFLSQADTQALSQAQLTRAVFDGVADDGGCGDYILVLGFQNVIEDRVPKAVELYRQRRGKKLLFSGAPKVASKYGILSEAELMKRYAMELGVADTDIITDELARNTEENMLGAALAMQRDSGLLGVGGILLVTSPQHMKRALCLARCLLPGTIHVTACPADGLIKADNWFSAEDGRWRRFVYREAQMLKTLIGQKLLPDIELD